MIGVAALTIAYRGRLRRGNFQHDASDEPSGDRWRYALCGIAAGLAMLCAYYVAAHAATLANGEFLFNVFVFRFVVDSTVVFTVIYLLNAWVCRTRYSVD